MFAARSLALATLAIVAQVASAASCSRSYTIKAGDYCDKISAANNVSTYQLAANNPGVINEACSNLVIGGTLCLGNDGEDCSETYTVVAGDYCSKIWDNTGVNATIFSFNNPQVNEGCTNIYPGQVLCIAKSVVVPAAPGGPIHTVVPPAATTAIPVAQPSAAPATTTPPAAVAPATTKPVLAAPVTTKAPAAATPTPPPAADDGDEDCEEWEVVDSSSTEDLPFCDEVGVDV